jgi:quercetin dioxygenase-like cupin family protein
MMHPRVLRPTFERRDARGLFLELSNGETWQSVNAGYMQAGATLGHHYHKRTTVALFVLSGSATVRMLNIASGEAHEFPLEEGEGVRFLPYETHAVTFHLASHFLLLKSNPYDPTDPDTFAYVIE